MNKRHAALAVLLGCGALAGANATVAINTVGLVTTHSENFDGASSFMGGALVDDGADDYLWLTRLSPTATYSFSSGVAIASLELSFWYSGRTGQSGSVSLGSFSESLGNTPGTPQEWVFNNPGPLSGGSDDHDKFFSTTLNNLAAGNYMLSFSKATGRRQDMKIDDVLMTVTVVPEPQTYALMLAGLGVLGWVARKRRPSR